MLKCDGYGWESYCKNVKYTKYTSGDSVKEENSLVLTLFKDVNWASELAYLSGILDIFNNLNTSMQGKKATSFFNGR